MYGNHKDIYGLTFHVDDCICHLSKRLVDSKRYDLGILSFVLIFYGFFCFGLYSYALFKNL